MDPPSSLSVPIQSILYISYFSLIITSTHLTLPEFVSRFLDLENIGYNKSSENQFFNYRAGSQKTFGGYPLCTWYEESVAQEVDWFVEGYLTFNKINNT